MLGRVMVSVFLGSVALAPAPQAQLPPVWAPSLIIQQPGNPAQRASVGKGCAESKDLKLAGSLSFVGIEGGMFELIDEKGQIYDLHEIASADPDLATFLRSNPGLRLSALVVGQASSSKPDIHMRGNVVVVQKVFVTNPVSSEKKLGDELQKRMAGAADYELIPVVLTMRDQLGVDVLQKVTGNSADSRKKLTTALRELAETTQQDVRHYLDAQSRLQNKVARVKPLWITNSISVLVSKDVVAALANMPEIARIQLDEPRPALIP